MATVYWPFPVSTVTEWPASAGRPDHWGTDFGVAQGTPLRATADGTITRHNNDGLGAYVLDIITDDGLLIRNGHLSRMDVNTGQRVTAGQIIGLTGGQPGTPGAGYSTGPHLHWELRRDRAWSAGAWIDPRTLNPQPKQFGEPDTNEDDDTMLTLWRNTANGDIIAASLHTGYQWHLPNTQYITLMRERGMVRNQDFINMAPNEWDFLQSLLAQARANVQNVNAGNIIASVDTAAIAKAVNDDAARRMSA